MEGQGHLATEARGGLLGLGEINSMRHPEYRDTNEPRPDPAGLQWTRIRCQTIGRESTQQLVTDMPSFAPFPLTLRISYSRHRKTLEFPATGAAAVSCIRLVGLLIFGVPLRPTFHGFFEVAFRAKLFQCGEVWKERFFTGDLLKAVMRDISRVHIGVRQPLHEFGNCVGPNGDNFLSLSLKN